MPRWYWRLEAEPRPETEPVPDVSFFTFLSGDMDPHVELGHAELPAQVRQLRRIQGAHDAHDRQLLGISTDDHDSPQAPIAAVLKMHIGVFPVFLRSDADNSRPLRSLH